MLGLSSHHLPGHCQAFAHAVPQALISFPTLLQDPAYACGLRCSVNSQRAQGPFSYTAFGMLEVSWGPVLSIIFLACRAAQPRAWHKEPSVSNASQDWEGLSDQPVRPPQLFATRGSPAWVWTQILAPPLNRLCKLEQVTNRAFPQVPHFKYGETSCVHVGWVVRIKEENAPTGLALDWLLMCPEYYLSRPGHPVPSSGGRHKPAQGYVSGCVRLHVSVCVVGPSPRVGLDSARTSADPSTGCGLAEPTDRQGSGRAGRLGRGGAGLTRPLGHAASRLLRG